MPDQAYNTFSYIMASRGLVARFANDRLPDQTYLNLLNLESRIENALSTRLGSFLLTVDTVNQINLALVAGIHSLARLRGFDGKTYRYAGAGTKLYRKLNDDPGEFIEVRSGLSGFPFCTAVYRPELSSRPFAFIADAAQMLKDDGERPPEAWGLPTPTAPPTVSLYNPSFLEAENFEENSGFDLSTYAQTNPVNTTLGTDVAAPGLATVSPVSMVNIGLGQHLVIGGVNPETVVVLEKTPGTIKAVFAFAHLAADSVSITGIFPRAVGYLTEDMTANGQQTVKIVYASTELSPVVKGMLVTMYAQDGTVQEVVLVNEVGGTASAPDNSQNIYVQGNASPWDIAANPGKDYGVHDGAPPAEAVGPFVAGQVISILAFGSVRISDGRHFYDPNGQPDDITGDNLSDSGTYFPTHHMPGSLLGAGGLIAAWVDAGGVLVGDPFALRGGGTFTCPIGATRLIFGINDVQFGDNDGGFTVIVNNGDTTTVGDATFTAAFDNQYRAGAVFATYFIEGGIAAASTGKVTKVQPYDFTSLGANRTSDDDVISLILRVSNPSVVEKIRLIFDVGDGGFEQHTYSAEITS